MFLMGTHTPRLDDKGRLFLPAKFRDQLAEGLVVTRVRSAASTSGRMADFEQVAEQAQEAPVTARRRATTRACSSPAPPTSRPTSRAGSRSPDAARVRRRSTKDVVVIGVEPARDLGRRRWQDYSDAQEQAFSDLGEEVFPGSDRTCTDQPPAPQLTTADRTARSRARSRRHLGHLPRRQTATFPTRERAGTWSASRARSHTRPGSTSTHIAGVETMSIARDSRTPSPAPTPSDRAARAPPGPRRAAA